MSGEVFAKRLGNLTLGDNLEKPLGGLVDLTLQSERNLLRGFLDLKVGAPLLLSVRKLAVDRAIRVMRRDRELDDEH